MGVAADDTRSEERGICSGAVVGAEEERRGPGPKAEPQEE